MQKDILNKINEINKKQEELNNDIIELQNMIKQEKNEKIYNKKNKDEFIYYLQSIGTKENSIHKYIDALEKIRCSLKLFTNYELKDEIYFIDDIEFLSTVLDLFNNSTDMRMLNYKHHHVYSAAINNYAKFLKIVK